MAFTYDHQYMPQSSLKKMSPRGIRQALKDNVIDGIQIQDIEAYQRVRGRWKHVGMVGNLRRRGSGWQVEVLTLDGPKWLNPSGWMFMER
jgi:hypothetical protein